ncbi:hypothetical protein RclHR1_20300003 [Rhizophagus clarus]|uniref:Uncharacterized protein n=1 Tax=Rhizophagus clarus TaxID=94130 RepID=A0A2Z6QRD2_9GLOM|nr:hypothetical protein RclHR1_20300003 [Rhizophagus clarus]
MANININSSFDNLDLNILSSTKGKIDIRKDLDVYRENVAEKWNQKESLQTISSAIQPQFSKTNDCKGEWSHNHHSYPSGCSLLPLHDQLSPPKKRSQEEKEIHISEIGEISFSASRTTSSIDNYNSERSQLSSNITQCFLKIKQGEDHQHCIWCINYASQRYKEKNNFFTTRERLTLSFLETKWRCNFKDRRVRIWELCGDECLDFLMLAQSKSPNQFSNNIYSVEISNTDMQKLQDLSELIDTVKNDRRFHEFQPKNEWLTDQENKEYFSDAYGITNVNPLLVDNIGVTVLFLDDRGILFEWCELTKEMHVLGINEMEGLANFLYYPEKKLTIMEDTGEMIPDMELVHQAKELAKAELAELRKV